MMEHYTQSRHFILTLLTGVVVVLCTSTLHGQWLRQASFLSRTAQPSPVGQTYLTSQVFSGTGAFGINIPRGSSYDAPTALHVWMNTTNPLLRASTPFSTAKFTYVSKQQNPSYIHYGHGGDWIIQSSFEDHGSVYVQPRGGSILFGNNQSDVNDPRKKARPGAETHVNVYANTTSFHKTVYVQDPSDPLNDTRRHRLFNALQTFTIAPSTPSDILQTAARTQHGGQHDTGMVGINIAPQHVLDILSHPNGSYHPVPTARFRRSDAQNIPSYIHHLRVGNWIIQSASANGGVVYIQPRGGRVQVGTDIRRTSRGNDRFISRINNASFKVHATNTHVRGNLILHDGGATYNVTERVRSTPSPGRAFHAVGFQALTYTRSGFGYVDHSPARDGFGFHPSGTSKLNDVSVNILVDNENGRLGVDLNETSTFNNLLVTGSMTTEQLKFTRGNIHYTLGVDGSGHLALDSNRIDDSGYYFQINDTFQLHQHGRPKKLNISSRLNRTRFTDRLNGIYFSGKAALTGDIRTPSTLNLNADNRFPRVHIGHTGRTNTYVEVNGNMRVDGNLDTDTDIHADRDVQSSGHIVAQGDITVEGEFIGDGAVPIGTIIMWSGDLVPDGWRICNGYGGTPNLYDRFIIAAVKRRVGGGTQRVEPYPGVTGTAAYTVGQTGGNYQTRLTAHTMPRHRHETWGEHHDRFPLGNTGVPNKSGSNGDIDHNNNYYHTSSEGVTNPAYFSILPRFYALAYIMRYR